MTNDTNTRGGTQRRKFGPGYARTGERLTYFHGDMNGDGVVNGLDFALAYNVIGEGSCPQNFYPLPYGGETLPAPMNWNPNELWLPCYPATGAGSMGPP
jgi:hypothetical protein